VIFRHVNSVRPPLAHERRKGPTQTSVAQAATKTGVARLLLIVARADHLRYAYLKYLFDGEPGDVILDRRAGERRHHWELAGVERRRGDRRRQDITKDLRTCGWALVRHSRSEGRADARKEWWS
jgi:hypothetical protein